MSDHSEIISIQRKIHETIAALTALVPSVALARQVIEFSSDRRKQLVSRYMVKHPAGSATASDIAARADAAYGNELDQLAKELTNAHKVRASWDASMARLDAARSLLAVSRETLRSLPES